MNTPRYLCSQLVRLSVSGPDAGAQSGSRVSESCIQWANLEEIWTEGAVLECEEAVATGATVTMSADDAVFEGRATVVERDEFGWRVEMEFSALTPWSIERWRPEHALDPETLGRKIT